MINRKNLLGKPPAELGDKDAIHVAIVAVRAAHLILPGQRCGVNEHGEAVHDPKGVGIADPWMKDKAMRGDPFWLLLNQTEVPNVRHVWEHPKVPFTAPTRPPLLNKTIEARAAELQISYGQLCEAMEHVASTWTAAPYPGPLPAEEVEAIQEKWADEGERHELWSEFAEESGTEFENDGSDCCPEYNYPKVLF